MAAPAVGGGLFDNSGLYGIAVNVADKLEQVDIGVDQDRAIPSLKKMAGLSLLAVVIVLLLVSFYS